MSQAEYRSIDILVPAHGLAREHDAVRTWRLSDNLLSFTSYDFSAARGTASVTSPQSYEHRLTRVQHGISVAPAPVREHSRKRDHQKAKQIEPRVYALASITGPIAHRYQVDHALLMAIIHVESRGNPHAVSHRGAKGLMQIMPRTGAHYGAWDLFDQQQNITAGARYLRELTIEYGERLDLVIAAYNAGSSTIKKYGGRVPPYPETQQYVYKVTSYRDAYRTRLG
ncbi:lytic transglycosylase domain-containing protein [Burkholderia sp. 572]|uniref:lytic transglycosylase domain-containing protein n=1 Tax=Burkholderia sp. 572 TaxID=3156414 RepID=UPI003392755B